MQEAYTFHETYIEYGGKRIVLNDRTFLLDGRMNDDAVRKYAYVYNDLKTALEAVNGRERKRAENRCSKLSEGDLFPDSMITVYIAPYVYWIDDPEAADTVYPEEGLKEPYGMVVDCDFLKLTGLTEKSSEVVLAGNRGQSHGAKGNYTMFFFRVRHLELANLTMGNYCSVDLEYPSCPALRHRRRTEVITQAQLAKQSGDKLLARNCSFVSRLNLCPVCGGERCLYDHCHFESTDDALNSRAVYLGCDFDFYGSRPLYDTKDSGAVFLGCQFRSRTKGDGVERKQYFTKESGPVTVVDCEYWCEPDEMRKPESRISWTKYPRPGLKCYQYGLMFDENPVSCWQSGFSEKEHHSSGKIISIGGKGAPETVSMEGKELLHGYRLETEDGIVYNTFNLLRGMDEWDPMEMKAYALGAGKDRIPTLLKVEIAGRVSAQDFNSGEGELGRGPRNFIIGKEGVILRARAFYYYGREAENVRISYRVSEQDKAYVNLTEYGDGSCLAEGCNAGDIEQKVLVLAATPEGLEGAVELTVYPQLMEAPDFLEEPMLAQEEKGSCRLRYRLALGTYKDRSVISWYRCENAEGKHPVLTAVTRGDEPMRTYPLTDGDVGYYLMAKLVPCHMCSRQGKAVVLVSERPVSEDDILEKQWEAEDGIQKILISTDFRNMPTISQEKVRPGFWTVDCKRPADTMDFAKWEQSDDREHGGECSEEHDKECGREHDKECGRECSREHDKECGRECSRKYDREHDKECGRECSREFDREPWKYGQTGNGSVGVGLYQNVQGARLLYTPVEGVYGDMKLRLLADPAKTAGQGFGSAGQYMDICIKFDTLSLTGYGVRIVRTKEASDGVRFVPVQYDHGEVRYLNEGVMTSCYCTGCEIMLSVKGRRLMIHGESKTVEAMEGKCRYNAVVDMTVEVEENSYGGIAIWHTGTPGTGGWQNTTMLHFLEVSVKEVRIV